jgi:hypothetical protein
VDTGVKLTLLDDESTWYDRPLYKFIDGQYVEGKITYIQYDIAEDKSCTGAYSCTFQVRPFMTEDEIVARDSVLLYMQNADLFEDQQSKLSVIPEKAMDPKVGSISPNDENAYATLCSK